VPIQLDEQADGIAVVRICNPLKRNALDAAMFQALRDLWPKLDQDPRVRCVLLTGDGDQAFCAGADLEAHLDRQPGIDDLIDAALLKTAFFRKPLIAAIRGVCVAGGLELALAADIRIAADDARLGLPEVHWGIVPSGGGAMKLSDQIGSAKAMDLLLSGRLLSGREADAIGLVSQSCAAADVWKLAMERAAAIAANSPSAVLAAKHAALARRALAYARLEPLERELVALVRAHGDPEEGKAAFLARRKPVYRDAAAELLEISSIVKEMP